MYTIEYRVENCAGQALGRKILEKNCKCRKLRELFNG
jgi:hypothetical protein